MIKYYLMLNTTCRGMVKTRKYYKAFQWLSYLRNFTLRILELKGKSSFRSNLLLIFCIIWEYENSRSTLEPRRTSNYFIERGEILLLIIILGLITKLIILINCIIIISCENNVSDKISIIWFCCFHVVKGLINIK